MSVRSHLTGNLSVRRGLTDNLSVRSQLTGNLSVRRAVTDNLSVRSQLTGNLSVRRDLTDKVSVRSHLTDNLSVRRGLTNNLSVTDNLSCKGSWITSMAMDTTVIEEGATKHCSWGHCKSGWRYPESMPEGTHFIRFAKVGKVKDGMTEWEKKKQNELTEKPKKVLQLTRLLKIHIFVHCLLLVGIV